MTTRRGLRLATALLASTVALALTPAAGASADARSADTAARSADTAALQRGLDAVTTEAGAVGAIAELRDHGRAVWRGGSGLRELGGTAPAPVDGRFRAGSVTKTFVATVLLQLCAEGKVGLDEGIERYLPGVVPGGAGITVRQVLSHTAGIFDFTEDSRFAADTEAQQEQLLATDRWRTWTSPQLIAVATAHAPYFAPGQGWHYSNTDYLLIAEVIEKVSGHDWRTEVSRRVLQPLGLRQTSLPGTSTTIPGPHAHGYLALSSGPADITELNPSMAGAAGELISTTEDLTRFNAALLGGRLLAPAQLAAMTSTVPADAEPPTEYGLGLMKLSLSCGAVWGHPGGIYGYTTYVFGNRAGTRELAISATPYDPVKSARLTPTVIALIDRAFCAA
ncbi:serine hydrolase domain-containing protein [Kitasatospora sp. NPDC002227]|uniref:serine hydrolase domain-containing protein n=1 Tax=Kitasatospora sp. NPDC002227 TaxID=3154773 RepID=UPI0033318203